MYPHLDFVDFKTFVAVSNYHSHYFYIKSLLSEVTRQESSLT